MIFILKFVFLDKQEPPFGYLVLLNSCHTEVFTWKSKQNRFFIVTQNNNKDTDRLEVYFLELCIN